jgi:uncharacterized membrane protein
MQRNPRNRRGNTVVEFALALPVLLAMLTGVADYGLYFMQRAAVLNAAKDAARIAVASPENQSPITMAEEHAQGIVIEGLSSCDDCAATASVIDMEGWLALEVEVTRPFEPLAGLVPAPEQVSAVVTMALEHQDLEYYGL